MSVTQENSDGPTEIIVNIETASVASGSPASPSSAHLEASTTSHDVLKDDEPFQQRDTWALVLVKPFVPSTLVPWERVSMASSDILSTFTDLRVQREFRRFMLRDLSLTLIAGIFLFGAFVFPVLWDMGDWLPANIITGGLLALIVPVDMILHTRFKNTPEAARIRQLIQVVIGVLCATLTMVNPYRAYNLECDEIFDYIKAMGFPRPDVTPERQRYQCREAVDPFSIVTLTGVFSIFSLPPLAILGLLVYNFSWFIIMRLATTNPDPESSEVLFSKALMMITVSVIIFAMNSARYRNSMRQFTGAIEVVKGTEAAKQREEEVDTLLCAMVPSSALLRLSVNQPVSDYTTEATVLFSDMVQFTAWSSKRTAREVVAMLNVLCMQFDSESVRRNVEKIKTIGDAYWAVTGLPDECEDHAERMADFANKMLDIVEKENHRHPEWQNVQLRIGVHSGPLSGGILGTQQLSYEVFGHTSHIAEEVEKSGTPSRVVVSSATMECMGLPGLEETSLLVTKFMTVDDKAYTLYVLKRGTIEKLRREVERVQAGGALSTATPHGSVGRPGLNRLTSRHKSNLSHVESGSQSQRSSHSASHRSAQILAMGAEEAKKRRQEFLARRAESVDDDGVSAETLEDIERRYSARKYNWLLMTFADAEVEAEYIDFVIAAQTQIRRLTRFFTVLFVAAILLVVGVMDGTFSEASKGLFIVTALLSFLDLGLCFVAVPEARLKYLVFAQATLHHFNMLLLGLACGFMPMGAAVTTNDIAYVYTTTSMIIAIGNSGPTPALLILAFTGGVLLPVYMVMVYSTVLFHATFIFLNQTVILVAFYVIVVEKQYRQQFLEQRVAKYMEAKQVVRNKEQAALLGSMVPPHVTEPLMTWLGTNMAVEKGIIQQFPMLCVAFVKLSPSKDWAQALQKKRASRKSFRKNRSDLRSASSAMSTPNRRHSGHSGLLEVTSVTNSAPQLQVLTTPSNLSPNDNVPLASNHPLTVDVSGGDEELGPMLETPHGDDIQRVTTEVLDPEEEAMLEALEENAYELDQDVQWLAPTHSAVDEIIKKFPAMDKIKTIGENLMLAGPFSGHTVTEACDQLVALLSEVAKVTNIQAGMHVGEIVGAVLGTNRLCFDIFGDTVNTSSRCMSTGGDGDITCSEEFYAAYLGKLAVPKTGSDAQQDGRRRGSKGNLDLPDSFTAAVEGVVVQPGFVSEEHKPDEASPTATSASRYETAASDAAEMTTIHRYADGAVFSGPVQRAAKGKGHITVHLVQTLPPTVVYPPSPSIPHQL